ncbi:hypothetical protein N7532_010743 [Penicillium argentinense]|uniref:HpcH/HpaI aldolase/citrate lyase domain-containing protein n=1 Tax=Penicillium argentinense TaxID=1131581 RepID=A0A9W9EQ70_9EURO|nr:uncharacterized protein N7532_010743 [Penicillium argentinense]KAJ5085972.1 hypothetical protein N7532_010743 [Penicillium argentinense]
MEHSTLDMRTMAQLILACKYVSDAPVVRSPSKSHWHISRILDAGAAAVVIPHTETVQGVRDLVHHAKYDPLGACGCTNNQPILNFHVHTLQQNEALNTQTMLIPMIETLCAVDIAEEPSRLMAWTVLLLVLTIFAFPGVSKGFDEVSFVLDQQTEDEYANTKGWIVAMATAGAVFRCFGCLPITDRFARRWALVLISPKAVRGVLTLQYAACQQLGVVFDFFINYGVTKSYVGTNTPWMLPTLLQLLPATIWSAEIFFAPNPLAGSYTTAGAKEPSLPSEIGMMDARILHESEEVGSSSQWQLLKETFVPVENRRRFFVIVMATLFSQWFGANAITQYSPTIGDEAEFLATGIYAVVKFVSTLAFALIHCRLHRAARLDQRNEERIHPLGAVIIHRASTGAIVAICFHAVAWSIGWFSIPYQIGSDLPDQDTQVIDGGRFFFFGVICLLSFDLRLFRHADTTGRSLEALDNMFHRSWYTVHRVADAKHEEIKIEHLGKAELGPRAEHQE